jgi:hypothetical protein
MSNYDEFIENLVSLGEDEVRKKLSLNIWSEQRKEWVNNWLTEQDQSRENDIVKQQLSLSADANEIARSALKVARRSFFVSLIAIVVSSVTAIIVALI